MRNVDKQQQERQHRQAEKRIGLCEPVRLDAIVAQEAVDDDRQARAIASALQPPSSPPTQPAQPSTPSEEAWPVSLSDAPCPIRYYNFDYIDVSAPVPGGASISCAARPPRIEFLSDTQVGEDDPALEFASSSSLPHGAAGSDDGGPTSSHRASAHDGEYAQREVVIDDNGQPRQAGATMPEGEFIKRFRQRAEQSLFVFLKGVLGRFFLTPHFHRSICHFIEKCPPFRKLVLMPREHAKTTIVAGGLPPHILIQPAATNIYFPGLDGSECRILLAGETETMAKKNLRVVQSIFEENKIFRAFWPERVWDNTKQQSKQWSSEAMIIPRRNEWPDPSIRAIGVGGAITGARPNVMIKDDLISFKAANSEVVMEEAIEWHKASRALLDKYEIESGLCSLEFIIGCLTADTDVTMADGTKHKICDVKVGDFVFSPDPDGYVYKRRVEKVIPQGFAEIWTIKTTTHDIKATGNHPFLISAGTRELAWRRADQLQVGDLIVAHKALETDNPKKFEPSDEFCWLFGFMLGDGWVNNRERKGYVCFAASKDQAMNSRAIQALCDYFRANKVYLTKGGYYRTDSVASAQMFTDFGFSGTAKTKRVPSWVYNLSKQNKIAFLRGMCDADGGWQSHQTWRIEISNKLLLEDLRHLANLCGVRVGRLLTRERVIQAPNSPAPVRSICHSSSFNFLSIEREETINKNLYGGLNVGRDTKMSSALRFERVISVERNKVVEEVWDLTIEGRPAFFANGLAVHNTRWAVYDLYSHIIDNDPSVEVCDDQFHRIIRDGKILWPEKYTQQDIDQLQTEHGSNFFLLYLNSAADPSLTDFDMSLVRDFTITNGVLSFEEDERDLILAKRDEVKKAKSSGYLPPAYITPGERLNAAMLQRMIEGGGGMRLRG